VQLDVRQALSKLLRRKEVELVLKSILLIKEFLEIAKGSEEQSVSLFNGTKTLLIIIAELFVYFLGALTKLAEDSRQQVFEEAMNHICELLALHCESFSVESWQIVFSGVVKHLFGELLTEATRNRQPWFLEGCRKTVHAVADLVVQHGTTLRALIAEIFGAFEVCFNDDEQLIETCTLATKKLIFGLGSLITAEHWNVVVSFILKTFRNFRQTLVSSFATLTLLKTNLKSPMSPMMTSMASMASIEAGNQAVRRGFCSTDKLIAVPKD